MHYREYEDRPGHIAGFVAIRSSDRRSYSQAETVAMASWTPY
jgi:hypothetical protein